MLFSIAICTWNRSRLLDKTLAAMEHLIIPDGVEWELLIVNNNCSDDTDAVISKYTECLPIRRIFEPKQGLSNARNSAVVAAKGEYIIWTDDDVLVDKNWIMSYRAGFEQYSDGAFFGGPITPWFEGTPPSWLQDSWSVFATSFATRDLGATVRTFSNAELPFGANYAIRRDWQLNFLYNPKRGLCGNKLILGEENEVMNLIIQNSGKGWWLPDAKVRHWIPKKRQSLFYIIRYYFGSGYSNSHNVICGGLIKSILYFLYNSIFAFYFYVMRSGQKWAVCLAEACRVAGAIKARYI